MKQTKLILYALALMGFVACSSDDNADVAQKGYLSFSVSATDVVEDVTRATIGEVASGYTAPADGDFSIEIINEDDEKVWSGKVSEWSSETPLGAGNYTVKASYENGRVGFNNPVFEGSASIIINGGETTEAEIPVSLKNAIVRVKFTDMFKSYYSFDKFTITSLNIPIEFTANETRGAFIEATTFSISATLTSQAQDSEAKIFNKTYSASEAKCYTITFDASNIGGAGSIQITFGDEPTETIELGDIELNE